jgi:signal peptidase I
MSKRKSPVKPARAQAAVGIDHPARVKSKTPKPAQRQERHGSAQATFRETVESVVIAFVLAFLFRTFEAEAFVIPTGSMATTLMGRHKDLECPMCGYQFQVSSSGELTTEGAPKNPPNPVTDCTCPMCRYRIHFSNTREYPSFPGDRILVGKFAYQFRDPERWDVAVFHYPGEAQINYIKRVVGLPGETIRIQQGDIYVQRSGDADFAIVRDKPAAKLLAMLQPVYDNDLTPRIKAKGWPVRWRAWPAGDGGSAGSWKAVDDDCAFETDGAPRETWIRYEHRTPSSAQWERLIQSGNAPKEVQPALISDLCGYDSDVSPEKQANPDPARFHWVGDLAIQCALEVQSESGQAILELVKGGWRFQCRIDVSTGDATLSIEGKNAFQIDGQTFEFAPTAKTKVRGKGKHEVLFANCDRQLRLWIDGQEVTFDAPTEYPMPHDFRPTRTDLAPVRIGSYGAALRVSHLRVLRDLYYSFGIGPKNLEKGYTEQELLTPEDCVPAKDDRVCRTFKLGADQFFMLGDNSPQSRDSREWDDEYYVKRELLIGKAFFIYWPHSWDWPIPFWPNFRRMSFVK